MKCFLCADSVLLYMKQTGQMFGRWRLIHLFQVLVTIPEMNANVKPLAQTPFFKAVRPSAPVDFVYIFKVLFKYIFLFLFVSLVEEMAPAAGPTGFHVLTFEHVWIIQQFEQHVLFSTPQAIKVTLLVIQDSRTSV